MFAQAPVKFMGRVVTITEPAYDDGDHTLPKGPASVCVEGTLRQCYTAPRDFGRNPEASVVQVDMDTQAILFSAASPGVAGWSIHLSLLRPEASELSELFNPEICLTNLSSFAWWHDAAVSRAKIFLTADYIWGPGECRGCEHRWIISTYLRKTVPGPGGWGEGMYALEDRYMTVRKYDSEKTKILDSEKPEILARLKRVKQQSPRSR